MEIGNVCQDKFTFGFKGICMNKKIMLSTSMIATAAIMFSLSSAGWTTQDSVYEKQGNSQKVQLGPRPFSDQ